MLKQLCVYVCAALSTLPALAAAQTREAVISEVILQGTVQAVDHVARTVTIRGQQGNVVTLDVPASVTRFDQIKVGDTIRANYYDGVNLRLKPVGEPDVDRTEPPATSQAPGELPGATRTRQRVTTVTVTAWDPATQTVTFTTPKGLSYTRRLAMPLDPRLLAGLKVGDRVDVTRTEAVSISVSRPFEQSIAASAPTPAPVYVDPLGRRFSLSVQWGVDNQFSGKVIEEASGRTVTGVPINLEETTYDELYGRMGFFKVGAGYRISPRSDVVANFVLSRSGSERVTIGTVGATAVPLHVDFTDIDYWGFEGGQNFYFSQARIVPFAGYLLGANRYGDVRGTFVDVPASVTPGLQAQDGKFFEKSWAFSVGPTGGVMVDLGPVAVTGEVQLRYMGGLSDVDWLVEEGLRDINSESSRWSFPILFGAKFRF